MAKENVEQKVRGWNKAKAVGLIFLASLFGAGGGAFYGNKLANLTYEQPKQYQITSETPFLRGLHAAAKDIEEKVMYDVKVTTGSALSGTVIFGGLAALIEAYLKNKKKRKE